MTFLIGGANSDSGAYQIDNSLRFNKADSAKLSFTQGTPTSRRTWTYSTWVKRGNLADQQESILSWGDEDFFDVRFQDGTPDDGLLVYISDGDSKNLATNRLFRDPATWYHIIVASDTTDGTAGDRTRIYVNGVEETSFAAEAQPDQNYDYRGLVSGDTICIGNRYTGSHYLDGYLADTHFIDGQQLAPSSFGETNDNGVWIPIEYDGSYGTNGFKLEYKQTGTSQNSSGIGADTGGNDNHFAVTNLAATDVTVDTPTNNFATLIPALNMALSEGNTKAVTTRTGNWDGVHSSIGVTSGKWYFEVKASRTEDNFRVIGGVAGNPENFTIFFNGQGGSGDPLSTYSDTFPFFGKGVWLDHWYDEDYNSQDGSASVQSNNDILQFALDMDNYKLWVGVNGQFKDNSNNNVSYSDVAAGNSATVTIASGAYTGKTFFPAVALRDDEGADDNIAQINFGNPSFSISSGNSDGLYGNFEYAVPSGYYALCTKRLAEYG